MEIKQEGQGKVFDSKILEVFTRAAPQISAITYVSVIFIFSYLAYRFQVADSFLSATLVFVGATLSWTFFEDL